MSNSASKADTTVLVTGGSGHIGAWCVREALFQGYKVRTTVRTAAKFESIKTALLQSPLGDGKEGSVLSAEDVAEDRLTYVIADLTKDEGWTEAVKGCKIVLHVASPFPRDQPKDEMELIRPAKEGTLKVLRAAVEARKTAHDGEQVPEAIVVTSSVAAVSWGHPVEDYKTKVFSEKDWSNYKTPVLPIAAYMKSKVIAEEAAWDYMRSEPAAKEIRFAVINPAAVFGPPLRFDDENTSVSIIGMMLRGQAPMLPPMTVGVVDVRDVAKQHLLAATSDRWPSGERWISTSFKGAMPLTQVAQVLKDDAEFKTTYPKQWKNISTRALPAWIPNLLGYVSGLMKTISIESKKNTEFDNTKTVQQAGYQYISAEEAIKASAVALIRAGKI